LNIDIEDYYTRFGPMVYRRCLFLLKDEDKAYDALQEVFIRLIKNRERLIGKYPSSLLFRIATNICLNILESDKYLIEAKDDILLTISSSEDVESRYIAQDLLNRIFIDEKESTRTIAVMYYIDKMTLKKIALEVGLSLSGVKKRLSKLKENLRMNKEIVFE
jgi:RNA polymerase sigma-70 factor, ECF subfamily